MRTRSHGCAIVCVLCVCSYLHAAQVFRSDVDGVTIQVSVTQRNRPVAGLTTSDFQLLDNGVLQTLSTFEAQPIPLDLTLLLDLSTSVDGAQLQRLKTAVRETAALLHSDDRIRLVVMSQVLREVVSLRPASAAIRLDDLSAGGATSLYDGLAAALMRRSENGRRQLIVALTDGRDSSSILAESDVKDIARLSDAVIDLVVAVGGSAADTGTHRLAQRNSLDSLLGSNVVSDRSSRPSSASEDERIVAGLRSLAAATGGDVMTLGPDESLSRSFAAVLNAFRAGYVLQYMPHDVAPGGWHEVTVSVKKGGHYDVRARRGYRGRSTISEPVPKETR